MGGCRCSFRQCANSSLNSPGYHFFHFPIRDPTRCQKWADFSDKKDFLSLPQSVLKNKVICQDHFKESNFMNYLKESLIKTAVPTLHIENDEIIDLESVEGQIYMEMNTNIDESDVIENKTNKPITQQTLFKVENVRKRRMVESSSPNQSVVKLKIDVINDKNTGEKTQATFKPILTPIKIDQKKKLSNTPIILNKIKSIPKILNTTITQPISTPVISESSQSYDMLEALTSDSPQFDSNQIENQNIIIDTISVEPHPPQIDRKYFEECLQSTIGSMDFLTKETFMSNLSNEKKLLASIDEMVKKLHLQQKDIIEYIQKQPTPAPADSTTTSCVNKNEPKTKFNQNKIQLFAGIKKYLSPAMVTMLRVELFGTADREWKADEKSMMTDVLRLGSNVYEFMRDEWRLRFPPLKDVESWMSENLGNDDEMDC